MPLQIRRGTTAQRLAITPLTGELVYDTITGQLFVGNGTTLGGVITSGITTEDAQDAAASLFTTGSHSGITFAYNDTVGRIDATVTVAATGPFDGDLTGSVFADDSTLLVDGTSGALVGSLRTSGDVYITKNSYSAAFGTGFTFAQHHSTVDATNFNFYRTRGTDIAPTAVVNGDDIADVNFVGYDGTNRSAVGGISVSVGGTVSAGIIPGQISLYTRNTAGVSADRATLTSEGVWGINQLGAFSGTTINVVDNNTITLGDVRLSQDGLSTINTNASLFLFANGTGSVEIESVRIFGSTISAATGTLTVTGNLVGNVDGDLQGSVFADNSARIIDNTAGGNITAATASLSRSFELPVYADATARDATLTAPVAGMMIFNTALIKFQGYTGAAWVDLN